MVFKYFLHITYLIFTAPWIKAELFTALSDVEPLVDSVGKVVDTFDKYLQNEKIRLNILEKQLQVFKKVYTSSLKDASKYLENPINSFTIIKRLTVDLDATLLTIESARENIENAYQLSNDILCPASEDLTGAALALSRLQDTYELNVSDLANGRLSGEECSDPMSANDCFILGQQLFNKKNYEHALQWFKEALDKHEAEKDVHDIVLAEILKYISHTYYRMDNMDRALELNEKILKLNPNNTEVLNNVVEFQKSLYEDSDIFEEDNSTEDIDIDEEDIVQNFIAVEDHVCAALCRGDIEIPENITKRFKCRYLTETHPFLKLAPIKMEQLHMEPDVFLFHQVISDDEINHLKNMAKPQFNRATIVGSGGGDATPSSVRICKSGWLRDNESPVVSRITRRVSDFTGLDMKTAENIQVANYGIGGHYVPHFDFMLDDDAIKEVFGENGNRIATILFYMSDVHQGGATVFIELGFRVLSVKNAALFWTNLHPSGEGNTATRHAACPVLQGSKWIASKWVHQVGQELIRPCDLENPEKIDERYPVSVKVKTKNQDLENLIYDWYSGLTIQKLTNATREQRKESSYIMFVIFNLIIISL